MKQKMKYDVGDVVTHASDENTIGLVVEIMPAWENPDGVHFKRHMSGNQYQVYWTICPAGDRDLDECWYPEEHVTKINKELTQ